MTPDEFSRAVFYQIGLYRNLAAVPRRKWSLADFRYLFVRLPGGQLIMTFNSHVTRYKIVMGTTVISASATRDNIWRWRTQPEDYIVVEARLRGLL